MSVKLFILGRPGSGKSTAFRFIRELLKHQYNDWFIAHYNDYDILQELFLREKLFPPKKARFEAKELDGFDVLDFTVLDEVLTIIEKSARASTYKKKEELVIIEFARQDYNEALHLFSDSFFKDAYFLFLDADLPTCVQRVKDRVTFPPTPDNHYVSENILRGYYGKQVIPPAIKTKKGKKVDRDRTRIVSNRGDLDELNLKIEDIIHYIIEENSPITKPHSIVLPKQRKILVRMPHLLFFTFSFHTFSFHTKNLQIKTQLTTQLSHMRPFFKKLQKMFQRKHTSSALESSDR